jgi:hypothetical protein
VQTQSETNSTLQELAQFNAESKSKASNKAKDDELPEGQAPLEAKSEEPELKEGSQAEAPIPEAAAAPEPDVEEEIRIGDKTFKSQREAIKYAEQLEHDKLVNEAYTQGIRDAAKVVQPNQGVEQPKPEDDKFEERFYSDPKGTLTELKERAKQEALDAVRAEQRRESLWTQFFDKNPDLANSREICEQVLARNWDTLGQMTDLDKAMSILATKTRSIFQDYMDRAKPRTELPNRGGQAVSAGSGASKSVTPPKKEEPVLDFVSQMKRMKSRA